MYQRRASKYRCSIRVLLAAALSLGATPAMCQFGKSRAPGTGVDASGRRDVQAVQVDASLHDGQTSWIITPDVPRIPKIKGLNDSLPPHIESRLRYSFDLAQRGATYSAHSEFRAVLELCALELDAREGGTNHRQALREGWMALHEADDFADAGADGNVVTDARLISARHATRVLEQTTSAAIDPIKASQAYYAFAEQRLTYACGDLPASSLAYYGLGRTCVVPGSQFTHAAGKAALLQSVALDIAPQNVLAANELGVLLAQHGHLEEAQEVFKQCVATDATPEAWRNLAVVYARRGDVKSSKVASAAGEALAAQTSPGEKSIAGTAPAEAPASSTGKKAPETRKPSAFETLASKLPAIFRR